MNRKLQHSVTALSATAAVFGLLLLAGGPPPMSVTMPTAQAAIAAEDPGVLSAEEAATPAEARRVRRARTGLALPYFSFAQGLRTVTGS